MRIHRKPYIFLFILFFSLAAWCSSLTSGIGLSGGVAIPLAEFGDDESAVNLDKTNVGFANGGFSLGINGDFHFFDVGILEAGFTVDISAIVNTFDDEGFILKFRNQLNLAADYALDADADFWWLNVPIMAGPSVVIHPSHNFDLYAKGLIGVMLVRPPSISITGENGNAQFEYELTPSLGLGAETGFKIDGFRCGLRIDYCAADEIDAEESWNILGINWNPAPYEREFPVTVFRIIIGYDF